jgi:tripartite-type tricarboxylate transporter receptor subunit TctC
MRKACIFLMTWLAASSSVAADEYPAKTVRVIVPFAAGGLTDIVARLSSQHLSEQLGKPFVVENRTGASGTIANEMVARSAPDGYTLMMADTSTVIAGGGLHKALPFNVAKDFTPISQIVGVPNVLVVRPSLQAKNVKDLVALAHSKPGQLNYGSAGPGSAIHLYAELFKRKANVDIAHIPYKGGSDALAALMGDQVDMVFISVAPALPAVNSGKLRALAVTTDGRRSSKMPDVPSMSEAGVSDMSIYTWIGLVGPAGMPKDIVDRLQLEVKKAIASPAAQERLAALGGEAVGSSPEAFSSFFQSEIRRWSETIKSTGLTPE